MRKQIITETWARAQSGLLGAFYVCCFWGNESRLHRFLQIYTVEKTRIESHKQGYSMTEQMLADGSVRLTVAVGGAAS